MRPWQVGTEVAGHFVLRAFPRRHLASCEIGLRSLSGLYTGDVLLLGPLGLVSVGRKLISIHHISNNAMCDQSSTRTYWLGKWEPIMEKVMLEAGITTDALKIGASDIVDEAWACE